MRVLICDDSSLARNQLARALPESLHADINYASNGQEALEAIRSSPFELLILDLTMPVMDGYAVLEQLRRQRLKLDIVVVSGDIQAQAQLRAKALGARAFIKKPCNPATLSSLLLELGYPLVSGERQGLPSAGGGTNPLPRQLTLAETDPLDRITEVANIAMGRAASLLAELLGVFVVLPLPVVNQLRASELQMAVLAATDGGESNAVCQAFIGAGIGGEALLMLHGTRIKDLAQLMNYAEIEPHERIEVLMDLASILISASLKGFEEQLGIRFSQGQPTILGHQEGLQPLLSRGAEEWENTLAIEFDYAIEDRDIQCTLLLLFSEDALSSLQQHTAHLD